MKRLSLMLIIALSGGMIIYAQKEGLTAIGKDDLRSHMEFFASDELKGREFGTSYNEMAANYIRSNIMRMGLKPDVDDYFQHMPLVSLKNSIRDSYLRISDKAGRIVFSTDSIMPLVTSSSTLDAEGSLVFAGFGYVNEETGYDDLNDLDVKNKIVLLMTRTPELIRNKTGEEMIPFTVEEEKIGRLIKQGAGAVLYVFDPAHTVKDPFSSFYYDLTRGGSIMPQGKEVSGLPVILGFIKPEVADKLLQTTGRTLEQYFDQIMSSGKPASADIPEYSISLRTAVERKEFDGKNVIGIVEGSDPVLKHECIVYTAHFDHEGVTENGEVFNGADDDASGSMALLELADAFMSLKNKPLRSVVFVWANGEEKGLIGSAYYVNNPAMPLEKTLLDINLDMIGRSQTPADTGKFYGFSVDVTKKGEVMMYSKHQSSELDKIISSAALRTGMSIRDMGADIEAGGSDHESFWDKGVQAVMFHTGIHPDTHRTTDDIDRIDFDKMEQVTKLVFLLGYDVANRREPLGKDTGMAGN